MNRRLHNLHKKLILAVDALSKRLSKTPDREEAEALLREMEEVNFRVMMVGRLLFKETTEALDERLEKVTQGTEELARSIREIESVKKVIRATGKALTAVDKVLDAAKMLA